MDLVLIIFKQTNKQMKILEALKTPTGNLVVKTDFEEYRTLDGITYACAIIDLNGLFLKRINSDLFSILELIFEKTHVHPNLSFRFKKTEEYDEGY